MRTEIDQREIKTQTAQTAAEARRLFEKVTFSLDVFFSRNVSPSHAKRSLLESKKSYNNKSPGSGGHDSTAERR